MKQLQALWGLYLAVDAVQLEINPLAETQEGMLVSVDAKLGFDDNAEFRQKAIFGLEQVSARLV